jgi:hypothetical protein
MCVSYTYQEILITTFSENEGSMSTLTSYKLLNV